MHRSKPVWHYIGSLCSEQFIRLLLIGFLAFGVSGFGAINQTAATENGIDSKPNVIVILTDDQGWGDLSGNGNSNLQTPNIDLLAKQGAKFDRFFVCPVCSPTRAEFLTGRYHPRSGVYSTSAGGERMDLDEITIAGTFKKAGYKTGAFGKWHNGMQYPYHPNGRGFEEYYGFCSGHWGNYFDPMLEHNGKITKGKGFLVDDLTTHLIDFVKENSEQPFFAYLPLNTPHSPMQVPDRWWDKFKNKELELRNVNPKKENVNHTRAALAMCENIDWNVGRIMKTLDELKLSDNTIVVYFCDNGPNGSRWNGRMKGRKGSTDEGGVRSPMFIRWPAKISKNKIVKPIGAAIDLLPTLAELCGIPTLNQPSHALDGKSLAPLLTGDSVKWEDRMIVSHWRNRVSVRSQSYRFDHQGKLFNMELDPEQKNDVAKKHPEWVAKFQQTANTFRSDVLKGYDNDERPFLIGHSDFEFTQIPARDGKADGNIKRSNRYPNCSYFTNWTSEEDKITWQAEVHTSGIYEVELYYSCPKADVGAQLELSFNDSKIDCTIKEPHDPPMSGAADDRVQRMESYVKDFRPMTFGQIELKKGKGVLTLKATKIPGNSAIDFRLLMLRRVSQ